MKDKDSAPNRKGLTPDPRHLRLPNPCDYHCEEDWKQKEKKVKLRKNKSLVTYSGIVAELGEKAGDEGRNETQKTRKASTLTGKGN